MRRLDSIFNLRYGHSLELNALKKVTRPEGVNFVSRAMRNNGVTARVEVTVPPARAGEITVALGGNGVLSAYLQPESFVCGRDVAVLTAADTRMSIAEKLWWSRCILENRWRYSYGRQANRTLAALTVPDEAPDWVRNCPEVGMLETNLKNYFPDPLTTSITASDKQMAPVKELFDVAYGQSLELNRLTNVVAPEGVNFVSRAMRNNGVTARVLVPTGVSATPAGRLSVALGGNGVLSTFYQPEPFVCGRDVAVLTPKRVMTVGELLWWCHLIHSNAYRHSYGRQANRTLATLMLPTAIPEYVSRVVESAREDRLFPSQRGGGASMQGR
jgi:hypothetical protein